MAILLAFGYVARMNPFPVLLLLFLLVPLTEIYFLIVVGGWIGALPTIALVVLTALIGATLARHQGLVTLQRVQASMARGELPAIEMLEGALLLVGGLLLLTPGFFTDAAGFICLLPLTRRALALWGLQRMTMAMPPTRGGPPPGAGGREQHTIEGEFSRDDDDQQP